MIHRKFHFFFIEIIQEINLDFFLFSINIKEIVSSSLTDIVRVCVKGTLWRRVSRRVLPKFIRAILQQIIASVHY